jgi:hypothetical protein
MSAEECQKHITLSDENANKYETKTMAVVSLVFSTTNPGWAAKAREIRTFADLQKVLLGFVADANMEESSMRSMLLSHAGDGTAGSGEPFPRIEDVAVMQHYCSEVMLPSLTS